MHFKAKTRLDKLFEAGVLIKAVHGGIETMLGLALLVIQPSSITRWIVRLTQPELRIDPDNYLATHILHFAVTLTQGTLWFLALYLLAHGVIKVVLVIEILRNHLWAYIGLMVVTAGFILYQTYQLGLVFSWPLLAFTLFDGAVLYLTAREYRLRQHHSRH